MHIVGSRGAVSAAERADQFAGVGRRQPSTEPREVLVDAARGGVARPSAMRIAFGLLFVVTLGWLIAAPSTPAMIIVISTLIACIGWSSEPDSALTLTDV